MTAEAERGERTKGYSWASVYESGFIERLGRTWLPLAVSCPVLAFIQVLLLFILYMTFVPGLPNEPGLTLKYWTNILHPYVVKTVIPNTLVVGIGSVLVSTFFALPLSWLLNRTSLPLRRVFVSLIAVVVIIPGFIKAMAWLMLVNQRTGLLNQALSSLLGLRGVPLSVENTFGMAWVLGLSLAPAMFFLISGPMRSIGAEMEEAAQVARANWLSRLWRIDLPLLGPAVLGAAIYNFMIAIAIFEVPAVLGGAGGRYGVLATELFYAVHPWAQVATIQYGAAGVYGTLIIIPSLVGLYFYYRMLGKSYRYGVITGKGYRPKEVELGSFKYLGLGFVLLYLLLAMAVPMLVLIWASLLPYLQMPSMEALSKLSLDNYHNFLSAIGGWVPLRRTAILIVSVSILVLVFSFMTSWVVVRTKMRGRQTLDAIAMLSHAIPGIAFAFALFMMALLLAPWLPLLGESLAIIVIAHTVHLLAPGTRITNAALLQVSPELEEAANVCGARGIAAMWRIVIPLVKPSLLYAGLWTVLLSFREVSMALFLNGPNNTVFSVAVWNLWQQGNLRLAAAGSVVLVTTMGLLALVAMRFTGGVIDAPRTYGVS
jgi:iron(III) transport system permease protein